MRKAVDDKSLILDCLRRVEAQRLERAADANFSQRVDALKRFQQLRFERTYADLLASTRYGEASRFFLEELYGPADFSSRDRQFERIVPKLVRMFPAEVVKTLVDLAELHAETEELDSAMARQLASGSCGADDYVRAWKAVGARGGRNDQLKRVLAIGRALNDLTRHAWLVRLLRVMRGPAEAAGLGHLQRFLESGLSCFCSMNGASEFLATVEERERRLLEILFDGNSTDWDSWLRGKTKELQSR